MAKATGKGNPGEGMSIKLIADVSETIKQALKGFETLTNKVEKDLSKGLTDAVEKSEKQLNKIEIRPQVKVEDNVVTKVEKELNNITIRPQVAELSQNIDKELSKVTVNVGGKIFNADKFAPAASTFGKTISKLKNQFSELDKNLELSQLDFYKFFKELTNEAKNSEKPIEELFNTMAEGYQHAEAQGYNMDKLLKHSFKPSELNKGVNSVFKRLEDFSKRKTVKELGIEFKVDEKLTQNLFDKVQEMSPGDMDKSWENMNAILKGSTDIATKYNMNVGAVIKKFKNDSDTVAGNLKNIEKGIKRSQIMKTEDIHSVGDAWSFVKNRMGSFVVGLGLLAIAWSVVGKMKEQLLEVNVALGGTASQTSKLQGNILKTSAAQSVSAEKTVAVANAFMSVNGQMRKGWFDSKALYTNMVKLSEVTGGSLEGLGKHFGELSVQLKMSDKDLTGLVEHIGGLGGLVGGQFDEMMNGVKGFKDQLVEIEGMSALEDLSNPKVMKGIYSNFNAFGNLAKEIGFSVSDMNAQVTKLATATGNAAVKAKLLFGQDYDGFTNAMKTGGEEAVPMFVKAMSSAGEEMDKFLDGSMTARDFGKFFEETYGVDGKMTAGIAHQVKLYAEQNGLLNDSEAALKGFSKQLMKRQKIEDRYKESLKSMTKAIKMIKETIVNIIASLIKFVEPVVSFLAGLFNSMPGSLKKILVIAGIIALLFLKFGLKEKIMFAWRKTTWAARKAFAVWENKSQIASFIREKAAWIWRSTKAKIKFAKDKIMWAWQNKQVGLLMLKKQLGVNEESKAMKKLFGEKQKQLAIEKKNFQRALFDKKRAFADEKNNLKELNKTKKQGFLEEKIQNANKWMEQKKEQLSSWAQKKAQFAWEKTAKARERATEKAMWAWRKIQMVGQKIAMAVLNGLAVVRNGLMLVFNILSNTNPIGLIVLGVVALITAFYGVIKLAKVLYNRFGFIKKAVDGIKNVFMGIWKIVKMLLLPTVLLLLPGIIPIALAVGAIILAFKFLAKVIGEVVKVLQYIWKVIVQDIGKAIKLLKDAFYDTFIKGIMVFVQQVKAFVTGAIADVKKGFGDFFGYIKALVMSFYTNFIKTIQDGIMAIFIKLRDIVSKTVMPIIHMVIEQIKSLWSYIQPVLNLVIDGLNTVWDLIKIIGIVIGVVLIAPLYAIYKILMWTVITPLKFLFKMIVGGIGLVWNVLQPIVKILQGFFSLLIKTVLAPIKIVFKALQGIFNIVIGIVKALTGIFTGNWGKAGDGLKQIWNGIVNLLWDIPGILGDVLLEALKLVFVTIPKWTFIMLWEVFKLVFLKLPALLGKALIASLKFLFWTLPKMLGKVLIATLKFVFISLPKMIQNALITALKFIFIKLPKMIGNAIVKALTNIGAKIKEFILGLIPDWIKNIAKKFGGAKDKVAAAGKAIGGAVTGGASKAWNFTKGLFGGKKEEEIAKGVAVQKPLTIAEQKENLAKRFSGGSSTIETQEQQLARFATGTEYISDTGPAIVHKGEAVIPAQDNNQLRQSVQAMEGKINMIYDVLANYLPSIDIGTRKGGSPGVNSQFDSLSSMTGVI